VGSGPEDVPARGPGKRCVNSLQLGPRLLLVAARALCCHRPWRGSPTVVLNLLLGHSDLRWPDTKGCIPAGSASFTSKSWHGSCFPLSVLWTK